MPNGHHGIEMVATANLLTFHLTDGGKPMNLEGGSFKAIIQTGAGTTILPLTAKGGSLSAKLKKKLSTGAKVALSGKDKSGHTIQARFVKK